MNAQRAFTTTFLFTVLIAAQSAFAFESGSDGSDGAFAPTADTQLIMNESGVFNFTTVDIPAGVTVTVQKNAGNTPLVILASGDVNILGTLSVNGGEGTDVGPTPTLIDGTPGVGGPGAADGGRGGIYISTGTPSGSGGRGLGAGRPGLELQGFFGGGPCGAGGGGYGSPGANSLYGPCTNLGGSRGGGIYGTTELSQLLAGSGGGGGSGGFALFGSGGGGGGGALLIASSGTVNIADTGVITANGGRGGDEFGVNRGGTGGGGSGGAIRIVATTVTGEGVINAVGGAAGIATNCVPCSGGAGGNGRIRLEAENLQRLAFTTPAYSFSAPRPIFLSGFPTLRITSVGGIATPTVPTGDRDVVLPGFTPNPVSVELATTGVPLGTTVKVIAKPKGGLDISAVSTGVSGSEVSGTASADINLPNGESVLTAQTTFTVTAAVGNALKNFAQGEQVKSVELAAAPGQGSTTTLITVSGKRYTWPSKALTVN